MYSRKHHAQARIARVGFLTSIIAYLVFLLVDIARPGFVARFLSVHIFLLAAIIFGVWWAKISQLPREKGWFHLGLAILFAIGFSMISWKLSRGLDERALITVVSALSPFVILSLIRNS